MTRSIRVVGAAFGDLTLRTGFNKVSEAKRLEAAQSNAAAEAVERAKHSLASLLQDYVSHQANQGRVSAREAKCIFDLHVVAAWPRLAEAPASELSQDQIIDMLRRLVEQGKGRTSNKLRTYLRAAYQCAIDVRVCFIASSAKSTRQRNDALAQRSHVIARNGGDAGSG